MSAEAAAGGSEAAAGGPVGADALDTEPLEIASRITIASNATFLGTIAGTPVVYKPAAGEKPLWDFPDGDLADRERAAYLVSEEFGWDIVPRTWLRHGPLGMGMVQLWQDVDPAQDAVDIVAPELVPSTGWRHVFEGYDERDRPVALIHEDSEALRRMAVFDVVVNNADRKGGHILEMPGGHRYGVDHGLTFHVEHKLRTVLWGWLGEELTDAELAAVARVRRALDEEFGLTLVDLLDDDEIDAFARRCDRLLRDGAFPEPHGRMPAVPYPIF
ncbi:SCO1664 family protein [Frondihabitans australicus]|uniref:Putative repeat protein (TIGR03843 family) n=1 Tax=Frondihabitans australicus TaxID=386892 RepID=A0A495IKL6_9MICO|nr:SCO1664 family protein [Frondihabitans australicus]RKR76280.1 putative repeat protein (TIGR03843 family) [Frondihabitans australicus]